MLNFGVKGDVTKASKVVDLLKLASNAVNVGACGVIRLLSFILGLTTFLGDSKTLVIHPASTTHSQLSEKEQLLCGVTPDLIRVRLIEVHSETIFSDMGYTRYRLASRLLVISLRTSRQH